MNMKPRQCTKCDGTGIFVNLYHPIPRTMGRGMSKCTACDGKGYLPYVYAEGARFQVQEIPGKPGQFEYIQA